MPPLIQISHLSKSYAGRPALADVTLSIPAHSFVALVGASGSGKTTLLKTINRLVTPDAGSVHLDGKDVAAIPASKLRRRIGYVFQGIGLFPHMSVAENIGIVQRLNGIPAAIRAARAAELLALVQLPESLAARAPATLSGGQAQRIGIARALAAEPPILLMDEPFGALDPLTRDALGRTTRALHERLKLTTILVTHDMAEALLLADRVIVLREGHIVADDRPAALLAGHPDPHVAGMIEVPRRQAERLLALRT